jgi:hypothetical protein
MLRLPGDSIGSNASRVGREGHPFHRSLGGRLSEAGCLAPCETSSPLVPDWPGAPWGGSFASGASARSKLPRASGATADSRRRGVAAGRDSTSRGQQAQAAAAKGTPSPPPQAKTKPPEASSNDGIAANAHISPTPGRTNRSSSSRPRTPAGSSPTKRPGCPTRRWFSGVRAALTSGYRVPLPAACTFSS